MAWVSAILGLVGALGGGAISAFGGDKPKTGGNRVKRDNPLYNAQLIEAMLGLGIMPSEHQLLNASPLGKLNFKTRQFDIYNNIIEQGIQQGLSDAEIAAQLQSHGVKTGKKGDVKEGNAFIDEQGRVRSRVGYENLSDLVAKQREYLSSSLVNQNQLKALQEQTLAGRRGAQSDIAGILGDFVAPTGAEIQSRASEMENILRAQIARERADSQLGILEQASALGINPAARLGRLDEWQAQRNLEAAPEGLARALQLLSGQQGLQANALSTLQNSLGQGTGQAQNLLGMQNSLGQQAAAQALALSNYKQGQANALGSAFSGALGSLAGSLASNNYRYNLEGGQAGGPGEPRIASNYDWNRIG